MTFDSGGAAFYRMTRRFCVPMKQISEVEEKTVHVVFRYLSIEACCRKGWGGRSNAFPLTTALFPS